MASVLAHAALPLVLAPAVRADVEPALRRRVVALAMALSCLPDLDLVSYALEVPRASLLAHRGLSHSIAAAVVLATVAGVVALRPLGVFSRRWWRTVGLLFAAAASHGLLDAMTYGDRGVALFAPFSSARLLLPGWLRVLPVCPLGATEYFGRWGLAVFANELLYVVAPAALLARVVVRIREGNRDEAMPTERLAQLAAVWLLGVLVLRWSVPSVFAPVAPRILRAATGDDDPAAIPRDDLPGGKLVTRVGELERLGLFDRELRPSNEVWSSSFFPWWFGGEAGRWQEGRFTLIGRTLFGARAPTEAEAKRWLAAASRGDAQAERRLFTLAPTEKVDVAFGHLDFPITRATLARTHNGHPRYWYGRCNGIAAASMEEPEPFRAVDVIGVDGTRVRFHPNDVKALLAVAYYYTHETIGLGGRCSTVSFDSGATCSMNPALLVLTLLNRVGLAHQSAIIDVLPTVANQYYAIAGARVRRLGAPRPPADAAMEPGLRGRVASLLDVAIDLDLSSTTLSYAPANVLDTRFVDGTHYRRVGLHADTFSYRATLALGADGELLGGRWDGDPANGPDDVAIVRGGPYVREDGVTLGEPEVLTWPFIRELARASVQAGASVPELDLRTRCDGRCPDVPHAVAPPVDARR